MLDDVGNQFLRGELHNDEKKAKIAFVITGVLIAFLLVNAIYLNILFFNNLYKQQNTEQTSLSLVPSPAEVAHTSPLPLSTAPTKIDQPQAVGQTFQNPVIKEYFVPMGSGANKSGDWEDVGGAQASVDLGGYGNVKEIRFEASVSVPTANQTVWVRLFNVTDKHPVWNSEVSMPGGAFAALTSQPVVFDNGQKVYQVQMKTQLQALANLNQAGLHILLK